MTTDTWHKVGVVVGVIGLLVAGLTCLAAWLAVPEIRGILVPSVSSSTPTPQQIAIDTYSLRVFNCDDGCLLFRTPVQTIEICSARASDPVETPEAKWLDASFRNEY